MAAHHFKKTKKNGDHLTCKFCHAPVWWDTFENRWFDVDGQTYHSDNCQVGKAHYSSMAKDHQENKRQSRSR